VRSCEFTVDTTAPATPTIEPLTGYPAVYDAASPAGGIGVAGAFAASSATPDVASIRYQFVGRSAVTVAGSSVTIPFTPSGAGPKTLIVSAVDGAGNVSTPALYRFYVKFAGKLGEWTLDTLTSNQAPNSVSNGTPFTFWSGVTLVDGPLLADFPASNDHAVHFQAGNTATTVGDPVVAIDQSFAVTVTVRPDDITSTATVLSLDGEGVSGFELGLLADAACPEATGGLCWSFRMHDDDASTSSASSALSDQVVRDAEWVTLIGVHDAAEDTIRLAVCGRTRPGFDVTPDTPFSSTWNAIGPLRLGGARLSGVPVHPWEGDVGEVKVLDNELTSGAMADVCTDVAEGA
jgi:hypothetical protein